MQRRHEPCLGKGGLRPTWAADAVLQALCGSAYDLAEQALGNESKNPGRPIRAHDLRYALSTLSPKRFLPTLPPTVGKVVSGLLGVTGRVTQSDLADFADVSARSIRNNRELLELVSLLDINEDGYRLALSFPDERQTNVPPELVTSSITSVSDVAYELLCMTIGDVDRLTGKTKAYVDELEADVIERSKAHLPTTDIKRKARRLAVLLIQDGRGWGYAVGNNELAVKRERDLASGGTVMRWELNPAILADHRRRSKQWKLSRELCISPSSDA